MAGRKKKREKDDLDGRTEANMETTNDQPIGFLDLPAELRNRVYRMRFSPRDEYGEVHISRDSSKDGSGSCLALLQTCRQIRDEAQCIYYAENKLIICHEYFGVREPNEDDEEDSLFLANTSAPRLHAITDLTIKFGESGSGEVASIFEELQVLQGLKKLRLTFVEDSEAKESAECFLAQFYFKMLVANAPAFKKVIVDEWGIRTQVTRKAEERLQGLIKLVRAEQAVAKAKGSPRKMMYW